MSSSAAKAAGRLWQVFPLLTAEGVHLVLTARREDRLKKLADELERRPAVRTRIVLVDLAADDFLPVVATAAHALDIGLLVNTAVVGTAVVGTVQD